MTLHPRILIADDHELLRRGLCTLLSGSGFEVSGEAKNGQEAVQMVKELKPDLVILDITMPVMNGLEAARIIRDDSPETKILVLTMHDSPQMAEIALHSGAAAFVLKSAAATSLVSTINGLLRPVPEKLQ